jgi:nitrogen-specific signal transduction histidine kinase
MFVPIMKLSENLKEISLSKENYNKFITYHELDIIYKNFNKVYIDLKEAQNQLKQMEMMRAVSSTIQKLAHDLRHPFAHIKNSLHVMLRLSSYEEIRQYILETGKSIEKDILGVENMLSDLLHFRTEESPHFVDTSFYQLLYSVIKNSFEMQKKVEISLDYKFNHKFMICVDIQKMERVLSNIITNAIEAMQGIGEMSFATREFVNDSIFYFELCISNTNSYIDENSGDKIFDLFFTQGKQRGTGLGLGIAKEIIEQHRGKIFYTSSVTEGVKFYIQLPQPTKLKEDINDSIDFPGDANFFVRNFDSIYNNSQVEYEKRSNLIEEKILSLLNNKSISKKFQILIGCSWDMFKLHIEQLFAPDMNWDNYGSVWCIDHINPCVSFDLTKIEQQIECFNYNNIRPCYTKENLKKNSNYRGFSNRNNDVKRNFLQYENSGR